MIGKPLHKSHLYKGVTAHKQIQNKKKPKIDEYLLRGLNYVADNSGCAHYRMVWPQVFLNSKHNGFISDARRVIMSENFYRDIKLVRMQRQVSSHQLEHYKVIRKICDKYGSRLVYELDDIPLYEDIPLFNRNRSSYASDKFRQNIITMMDMADEVTVTCKFMRDYFRSKLTNQNITIIPNYMPKSWIDRYYDEDKLKINFSKHKKKPRILYAGSGSHYGSGAVEDDFTKLEDFVRKTVKKYQWVFFGGVPRRLLDLYKSGKIEFHQYRPVVEYPEFYASLKPNIAIAPLLKNNFNRAKSNIKFIENAAMGIPCICQDNMETYEDALYKFDTEDELNDQINSLTKDSNSYIKACRKSRLEGEKWWLDDHLETWKEHYDHPYEDEKRVNINKLQ